MYQLGLKLWSFNINYIEQALFLYEKGYYNYIELYIVPNTYNEFSKIWKKLEIPYIIHAPHFSHHMCLSRKEFLDNNLILFEEIKKFTDLLNSNVIIFHPGIYGNIDETINQLKIINEPRIYIENKPYFILNSGIGTAHSPEQMKYLIKNTNIGFCYDIGHGICSANSRKKNIWQEMDDYLKLHPKIFHLTDGHMEGIYDQHLHLEKGNFDFKRIIKKIPSNSLITLETYKDFKTHLNDFKKDCECFYVLSSNYDKLRYEKNMDSNL